MSQKSRGRPFAKGISGNPAGRPRAGEAVAEYIRELGGPDGRIYVDRLHALAVGDVANTRAMLGAIGILLERGFGKAPQAIEHSGSVGAGIADPSRLEDQELAVACLIARKLKGESVPELVAIREILQQAARSSNPYGNRPYRGGGR
jgi:hypothetical protein